jgi:co-chaperonin GroES (HSP10)
MIINNINYDLSHIKRLGLVEAKSLTKKYIKPVNGNVYLLTIMAPDKTANGITIPATVKQNVQQKIQEQGVLVIRMCDSLKENVQIKSIKEGSYVLIRAENHNVLGGEPLKHSNGQKYGFIIVPFHCIVSSVIAPNYDK